MYKQEEVKSFGSRTGLGRFSGELGSVPGLAVPPVSSDI